MWVELFVGGEGGRGGVGGEEPDLAGGEVVEERREVDAGEVAGPDDFSVVDVGGIVDPLLVSEMVRRVVDDHEMVAGDGVEGADDAAAHDAGKSGIEIGDFGGAGNGGTVILLASLELRVDANGGDGEHGDDEFAGESDAGGLADERDVAKMAHGLRCEAKNYGDEWASVVREKPGGDAKAGETDGGFDEQEADAAVVDGPGETENESHYGEASPKRRKRGGSLVDVLKDDLRVTVPDATGDGVVCGLVVEDLHLWILGRSEGAEFAPDEGRDGVVLRGVGGVGELGEVAGDAEVVVGHEGESWDEDEGGGKGGVAGEISDDVRGRLRASARFEELRGEGRGDGDTQEESFEGATIGEDGGADGHDDGVADGGEREAVLS